MRRIRQAIVLNIWKLRGAAFCAGLVIVALAQVQSSQYAVAQEAASDDRDRSQRTTRELPFMHVGGTVVDDQGRPVRGAKVALRPSAYLSDLDVEAQQHTARSDHNSAETDRQGRFSFDDYVWTGAPDGVVVYRQGYAIAHQQWQGGAIEIELGPGSSLSGTVVDDRDRPVADARVALWLWFAYQQNARLRITNPTTFSTSTALLGSELQVETQTDARGRFQLDDLPPDHWVVLLIDKPGFYLQPIVMDTGDDPLFVPGVRGGSYLTDGGTIRLRPATEVRVMATGEGGGGVPLRWAAASPDGYGRYRGVPWQVSGRAEIDGNTAVFPRLLPGKNEMWIMPSEDSGYYGVKIDFEMPEDRRQPLVHRVELSPGVHIEGHVVDDQSGEGVAGAHIVFAAHEVGQLVESQGFVPRVVSDENGRFAMIVPLIGGTIGLRNIPEGYVGFTLGRMIPANPTIPEGFDRTITPRLGERPEPIEFRLQRSTRVTARVLDKDGEPVPRAIWRATELFGDMNGQMRGGRADDQGQIELTHLFAQAGHEYDQLHDILQRAIERGMDVPEAAYAQFDGKNRLVVWSPDGAQTATVVIPKPDGPLEDFSVDVRLGDAGAAIGRFVDHHSGAGVEGVKVRVKWQFQGGIEPVAETVASDSEGRFRLDGLPVDVMIQLGYEYEGRRLSLMIQNQQELWVTAGQLLDFDEIRVNDFSYLNIDFEVPDIRRLRAEEALQQLVEATNRYNSIMSDSVLSSWSQDGGPVSNYRSRLAIVFGRAFMELAERRPGTEFEFRVLTSALTQVGHPSGQIEWFHEARQQLVDRHLHRDGAAETILAVIGEYNVDLNRKILEQARQPQMQAIAAARLLRNDPQLDFWSRNIAQMTDADFNQWLEQLERFWRRCLELGEHSAGPLLQNITLGELTRNQLNQMRQSLTNANPQMETRARRVIAAIDRLLPEN